MANPRVFTLIALMLLASPYAAIGNVGAMTVATPEPPAPEPAENRVTPAVVGAGAYLANVTLVALAPAGEVVPATTGVLIELPVGAIPSMEIVAPADWAITYELSNASGAWRVEFHPQPASQSATATFGVGIESLDCDLGELKTYTWNATVTRAPAGAAEPETFALDQTCDQQPPVVTPTQAASPSIDAPTPPVTVTDAAGLSSVVGWFEGESGFFAATTTTVSPTIYTFTNASAIPNGNYTLWVHAIDNTSLETNASVYDFTLAHGLPAVDLVITPEGWTSGDVVVSWTIAAPHVIDAHMSLIEDGAATRVVSPVTFDTELVRDVQFAFGDGLNPNTTWNVTTRIDRTAPLIAPAVEGTNASGVYKIGANFSYSVGGLDGAAPLLEAACDAANNSALVTEGDASIACSATDEAGNVGFAWLNVTLDGSAPTIVPPTDGIEPAIPDSLTITDAAGVAPDSVLARLNWSAANASFEVTPEDDGTFSLALPDTVELANGVYAIEAQATDVFGFATGWVRFADFTLSLDSPTMTFTPALNDLEGSWRQTAPEIAWEIASTAGATMTVALPDGATLAPESPYTPALGEGTSTLTFTATDEFDRSAIETVALQIDATAPNATLVLAGSGGAPFTSNVTVSLDVADEPDRAPVGSVACTIDLLAVSLPATVSAEGAHVARCELEDEAGNLAVVERAFTIDQLAPIPTLVETGPVALFPSTITFEDVSGVASAVARLVPENGVTLTLTQANGTRWTLTPDVTPPDGAYTIEVRAIDVLGHEHATFVAAGSFTLVTRLADATFEPSLAEIGAAWRTAPLTLNWTLPPSPVDVWMERHDGTAWTRLDSTSLAFTTAGSHPVALRVRDEAGHAIAHDVVVRIDLDAPALASPLANTTLVDELPFTFAPQLAASDGAPLTLALRVDGAPQLSSSATFTTEGVRTVIVDVHGDPRGTASFQTQLVLDLTAPVIHASNLSTGHRTGRIAWTITDVHEVVNVTAFVGGDLSRPLSSVDETGASFAFNASGAHTILIVASDPSGHTANRTLTITVDPSLLPPPPDNAPPSSGTSLSDVFAPRASFEAPMSATVGEAIALSAAPDDRMPHAAYAWSFGDGSIASGLSTTHAWSQPGVYTIRLDVTAADAPANSATRTIEIVATSAGSETGTSADPSTDSETGTVPEPIADPAPREYRQVQAIVPEGVLTSPVAIHFDADEGVQIYWRVNGEATWHTEQPAIVAGDGVATLVYYGLTPDGRQPRREVTLPLDGLAPDVVSVEAPAAIAPDAPLEIVATVRDATDVTGEVRLLVDGSDPLTASLERDGTRYLARFPSVPAGSYAVVLEATDEVGRTTTFQSPEPFVVGEQALENAGDLAGATERTPGPSPAWVLLAVGVLAIGLRKRRP